MPLEFLHVSLRVTELEYRKQGGRGEYPVGSFSVSRVISIHSFSWILSMMQTYHVQKFDVNLCVIVLSRNEINLKKKLFVPPQSHILSVWFTHFFCPPIFVLFNSSEHIKKQSPVPFQETYIHNIYTTIILPHFPGGRIIIFEVLGKKKKKKKRGQKKGKLFEWTCRNTLKELYSKKR